jgi:hypothetical protein
VLGADFKIRMKELETINTTISVTIKYTKNEKINY